MSQMKIIAYYLTFTLLLILGAVSSQAQTRIMPLGDSITQGVGSSGAKVGYRQHFWNLLKSTFSINLVGSLEDGSGFDNDHEGHPGKKSSYIESNLSGWLDDARPDIVLFHIGTNDISGNESISSIMDNIDNSINKIWLKDARTTILMSTVVPRTDDSNYDNNTSTLNEEIKDLVRQLKGSNPIILVDQNKAFRNIGDWESSLMHPDKLHPNDSGYQVMANKYYQKVIDYLSPVTPVELVTFTGQLQTNNATLNWTTASETNNLGFYIEHSFENEPFTDIAFIGGYGTTTLEKNYTFSHPTRKVGAHRFRLRQTDTDGTFAYSDAISLVVTPPEAFVLAQNYPNPFKPRSGHAATQISYSLASEQRISIAIYDLRGRKIRTLYVGEQAAGEHIIAWNGRTEQGNIAATGTYFIRMQANGQLFTRKLQIIL